LDPFFGLNAFEEKDQSDIKRKVKTYLAYTWKVNEHKYPELASLAKKCLGVQASSAGVERMFNFAGHIITNKRRRTGVSLFCNLVYLKLNESFL
jgi:hypothetical protein